MNSAAGAFMIAFPQTLLNTMATEPMEAFGINVRLGKMLEADGTLELVPHQSFEEFNS